MPRVTVKNPHCSMAMRAEHRSKYAALHRESWRLHVSNKFSFGTKNPKRTNNPLIQKQSMLHILININIIHIISLPPPVCLMKFKIFTMWHMATPWHKNSCPEGHEIYSFGNPYLVIITVSLVGLISERK